MTMTQIEKLRYIRCRLTDEDIFCQIAEEAAELAQAALKLRRTMTGTNPTPDDIMAAKNKLLEEIADVNVACDALTTTNWDADDLVEFISIAKLDRWVERLKEKEDGHNEN